MHTTYGIFLIARKQRTVLIVRPTGSFFWSLPKGLKDDPEESDFDAAKRELLEETNIDLDKYPHTMHTFAETTYPHKNKKLKCFFVSIPNEIKRNLKCNSFVYGDYPEVCEFQWVPIDNFPLSQMRPEKIYQDMYESFKMFEYQ